MRAPPLRRLVVRLTAVLTAFLALPASGAAQPPLAPGAWTLFEWFLGRGPVEGSGFLLDVSRRTRVRVTDAGVTGDAFDLFVDGAFRAATPSVPGGGTPTGLFDGDAAWAEPGLSHGTLFLDPGRYVITLAVRETAPGLDFGEGFLQADAAPLPVPGIVPEPPPLGPLAGGVILLAPALLATRRTRRRAR